MCVPTAPQSAGHSPLAASQLTRLKKRANCPSYLDQAGKACVGHRSGKAFFPNHARIWRDTSSSVLRICPGAQGCPSRLIERPATRKGAGLAPPSSTRVGDGGWAGPIRSAKADLRASLEAPTPFPKARARTFSACARSGEKTCVRCQHGNPSMPHPGKIESSRHKSWLTTALK